MKKSARQKLGESLVLQLNELFPTHDLQDVIDAVKKSNLDLDVAITILLETTEKKEAEKRKKEEEERKKREEEERKKKEEQKRRDEERKRKEELEKKQQEQTFPEEVIQQVMSTVEGATRESAVQALRESAGDVDMAVLTLLNAPPPVSSSSATTTTAVTKSTSMDDFVVIEEEEEEKSLEDKRRTSKSLKEEELDDLSDDEQWSMLDIRASSEEIQDTYHSDIEEEQENEEEEEEEVSNWFVDPLVERQKELERQMEQKKLQLKADEEFARALQYVEDERSARELPERETYRPASSTKYKTSTTSTSSSGENDINTISSGIFGATTARSRPRHTTTTLVAYSPLLQEFLDKVEERTVLELTGSVPKTKPKSSPAPRLGTVLEDVKKKTLELAKIQETKGEFPWEVKKDHKEQQQLEQAIAASKELEENQPDAYLYVSKRSNKVSKDFTSIEECVKDQELEIEAIKSYCAESYTEADSFPRKFSISIKAPVPLFLVVTLPPKYPHVTPLIDVRWNSIRGLSPSQYIQLRSLIDDMVEEKVGSAVILQVIDKVNEWIEQQDFTLDEVKKSNTYQDSLKLILYNDYKCLTPGTIINAQTAQIAAVANKLNLSPATVRILLRYFHWSSENLMKRFKADKEADKLDSLFEEVGVAPTLKPLSSDDLKQQYECPSCLEEYELGEMCGLACRHFYCTDCFSNYLKVQITETGAADGIHCPAYKCKYMMDQITIASLISTELYRKYFSFVLNSYVDKHSNIKWCPAKRCENAIQCSGVSTMVRCDCGMVFCFNCLLDGHWPATCKQVKWYNDTHERKHASEPDAEEKTLKWLEDYTQDCPNCRIPIEKNGGCNHMHCKHCNYDFCWICMGQWTGGSHYNCVSVRSRPSANQRELRKYFTTENLSFNQLYSLHDLARVQDDSRIRRIAEDRMKAYIQTVPTATLKDCEVITQALEHILLCRHIILNICVAGMYVNQFKLPGQKKMKSAIAKLEDNINFLCSVIDVPLKQLNISRIADFTKAVRNGIKGFQTKWGEILKEQRDNKKKK